MSGSSTQIVVDDFSNNPALQFVGDNWTHLFNFNSAVNQTVTYTTTNDSSIVFTFNGTAVGVAGILSPLNGNPSPISIYTIDDSPPVTYTAPDNTTNELTNVPFYVNNSLSPGVHKLTINVTRVEENVPYLLDYIAYLPPQLDQSSASMSISSSSAPSLGPIPSFTGSPTSSSSSTPVGAIVGGVVGGVAFLVIVALALWFFCRRRANDRPYFYQSTNATDMLNQEVKQSPVDVAVNPLHGTVPNSDAAVAGSLHTQPAFAEGAALAQIASRGSQLQVPPGKAAQLSQAQLAQQQQAVYHADSGVRFTPLGEPSGSSQTPAHVLPPPTEIPDDIPPMYTES